jgi:hypothetical protein
MKITICGSMAFAKEMLWHKEELEKTGHSVFIASDTVQCVTNPNLNMDIDHCLENDIQKEHFDFIADSDAILVLNYEKNGIKGYVGGSTLMEIAVARHLNKKIFLINSIPDVEDLKYSVEIQLTKPVIINGDLTKIS